MSRALVTGGAGLIGSHLADLLRSEGWQVRTFDALEKYTHPRGVPAWAESGSDLVVGDVRDATALGGALDGIDVVFHQAAYGGFFPDARKLCDVNVTGTATLLDTIREGGFPVRKVVVASSQVVYREGSSYCLEHGLVHPYVRSIDRLRLSDWDVRCPLCDRIVKSALTPENAPISGDTAYAVTKAAQEQLALVWSRQTGIPVVALRYACTFGPRQSVFNPYTGVIAIFCTRLLNGKAPILFEDGEQTRDFSYVEDVARANVIAVQSSVLDGRAVNVGTGQGVTVRQVAETAARALRIDRAPQTPGDFRPGDIRHMVPDISEIQRAGFSPRTDLETGIRRYVEWIREQGDVREYFAEAQARLREANLVRRAASKVAHA